MMDMQLFAVAVLKRLLVSLAIFAVGFVSICALFRVPSEDWFIAMLGALPCWWVTLIFVSVSVIWFCSRAPSELAAQKLTSKLGEDSSKSACLQKLSLKH
jgi:hypothetical protein